MESKPSPSTLIDQLVVPGDVILDLSKLTSQTIKLGGGLRQDGDTISVMKAGTLRFTKPNKYWVESSNKRYIPNAGDNVLGVVVDTKPENFIVDIKGPALAHLPVLSFEGGTRRNIPKFEVGTLLYVRVVSANTGMNPELSCMDANGKAGEYGILKEGYMFESSTGLARQLLSSPPHLVLEALGKKLSFEIAVGINGRFWVNASQSSTVILVGNAIQKSESLSMVQQKIYLDKLLKSIQ
ncbi:polyribonucleotide nucleotidyltransferase, Exosome complex RNA-binding protein 1/RRP40/RRP4 [Artemisia annua]|uniref:Ribosomal RNA-processing protein 40 n=1 Tax=Artemisia annua TaxID=35608 RepID=A0A2U1KBJ9_ARTAN|nr:polyribonucleotide nucleotidyltransferase, Exosome complex RNA-binding protein 1/RRP40/RRP4 [Artemisia annua]